MTILQDATAGSIPETAAISAPPVTRVWPRRPAPIFAALAALFGAVVAVITPPLRGPDEAAHFLRAYGISQGEIIPRTTDAEGRKGIFLPAGLNREFDLFETSRYKIKDPGFTYRDVFSQYLRRRAEPAADDEAPVFVLYAGSEGYSPVPYVPYTAAILVARGFGLDFLGMLYLMRFAGLAATIALAALAIALVPRLGWAFLAIAMLPAAIYGRAVVSADGTALALAMAAAALCLKRAQGRDFGHLPQHAVLMTLCALAKPPQLAFIVLEAMRRPLELTWRYACSMASVMTPPLVLSGLWVAATSADVAGWRLVDGAGLPAEQFDVGWKLRFMIEHPLHFPRKLVQNLAEPYELWRQLIGILGWLDTALAAWTYPTLSALLVVACLAPLELDRSTRLRVAAVASVAVLGYCLGVYLIFYLVWTAVDAEQIDGVQGRYFIAALPALAIVAAALVRNGPPQAARALAALAAAIISAGASIEAILRVDWHW